MKSLGGGLKKLPEHLKSLILNLSENYIGVYSLNMK